MNTSQKSLKSILLIALFLLLGGCAQSETPTPLPTQTPTQSLSADPFQVWFDGDSCIVDGPAQLPPGEHSYILYDTSDINVKLEVARFDPGKNIQDLFDIQKEPGHWWPKPKWLTHSSAKGKPWSTDDGGRVWTYSTYIQADYVIYVVVFKYGNEPIENKIWFCEQFSVQESSSE